MPTEFAEYESARPYILGMYARLLELKKTNDLKVLLSVGGWNFGSELFSDMVGDERLRKAFIAQATRFIRDHGFDGLDLDWVGWTQWRRSETTVFSSRP